MSITPVARKMKSLTTYEATTELTMLMIRKDMYWSSFKGAYFFRVLYAAGARCITGLLEECCCCRNNVSLRNIAGKKIVANNGKT